LNKKQVVVIEVSLANLTVNIILRSALSTPPPSMF